MYIHPVSILTKKHVMPSYVSHEKTASDDQRQIASTTTINYEMYAHSNLEANMFLRSERSCLFVPTDFNDYANCPVIF